MKFQNCIFFVLLFKVSTTTSSFNDDTLTSLANRIGDKLWDLGTNLTRHFELKSAFSHANVTELDLDHVIVEMTDRMHSMLERKKSALYRIVQTVEERTKNLPDELTDTEKESYTFKDAKNLTAEVKQQLWKDVNFFNYNVTINFSTVHVPTDVYNKSNETFLGIKASEELDAIFQHNYASDLTLSWQYFAGASGFTRMYPGFEWYALNRQEEKADLFDSRSRPWYVEAASDNKDIVILIDNSGSMMGQKRKIARHTVNIILETLGPNDFVTIFQFNDETEPVSPCFKDFLVQANLITVRELKFGVEKMFKANNQADFPTALTRAFEVLDFHHKEGLAAMCNQAIMLITDGVPAKFTDIFQKYNWKNVTEPPFPVRVFTYLIGRTGADFRDTKWMACANQGYYVQLNTIPEVKEQVLKYINVLARPLVLRKLKKIAWTSLYAHRVDPKITDFMWEMEQNEQQRQYIVSYRNDWKAFLNTTAQLKRAQNWRKIKLDQAQNPGQEDFHFVVSISAPAYDHRSKKNITEHILINEAYWTERVYEAEVASLLGVAGTDIPITEFRKLMKPYYLGVDNYGFIVNNNGYIIMHPDLRPFFRGTLKPGYNSVDMLEVELLDTGEVNRNPRDFDISEEYTNGEPRYRLSNLSLLRDFVINQTDSSNHSFQIKYHYDQMKRVATGRRSYFIRKIAESPFTLVLAVMRPPCNGSHCQAARVVAPDSKTKTVVGREKVGELLSGDWNIHPDWFYCKLNYNNELYRKYAEEDLSKKTTELKFFLKKMTDDAFWTQAKDPYAEVLDDKKMRNHEKKNPYSGEKGTKKVANHLLLTYHCDEELIRNVVFDANVTMNMFRHLDGGFSVSPELNFSEDSIQTVFLATHSGLTRWKDLTKENTSFGIENHRAIDETWYRRAVQQYYINKESFVFSIPLEEESTENLIVTASHAIFVRGKKKRSEDPLQAPAAVVGFQFLHTDFEKYVRSVVENVYKPPSETASFVVIDNNGYIFSADNTAHVGKFFGTLYPEVMRSLQECRIFRRIVVYDYQGVCFPKLNASNSAFSMFTNPLKQMSKLIIWTFGTFFIGVVQIYVQLITTGLTTTLHAIDIIVTDDEPPDDEMSIENVDDIILAGDQPKYRRIKHIVMLNRTRPQTCDRKVVLYQIEPERNWDRKANCSNVINSFRIIPHTNLILVILTNASVETNQKHVDTEPVQINTDSPVCHKVSAVLSRRRPAKCCSHDKEERKITLCGSGNSLVSLSTLVATLLTIVRILS